MALWTKGFAPFIFCGSRKGHKGRIKSNRPRYHDGRFRVERPAFGSDRPGPVPAGPMDSYAFWVPCAFYGFVVECIKAAMANNINVWINDMSGPAERPRGRRNAGLIKGDQTKTPGPSRGPAGPSRAGPSRAEPGRAGPSRGRAILGRGHADPEDQNFHC